MAGRYYRRWHGDQKVLNLEELQWPRTCSPSKSSSMAEMRYQQGRSAAARTASDHRVSAVRQPDCDLCDAIVSDPILSSTYIKRVQSPTRSSGAADRSAVCMRMLHVHAAFPHSPRPPHQRSETRAAGLPIWREGCSRSNLQTHRARVYHPMAPTSPQVRPEATYPATGAPRGYEAQATFNCVSMRTFVWKLACRAWTPPSLRCTRG